MVVETVLSREDKVDFLRRAIECGFFVRVFFVGTETPEINAARVTRRMIEGGHEVPINKIIALKLFKITAKTNGKFTPGKGLKDLNPKPVKAAAKAPAKKK